LNFYKTIIIFLFLVYIVGCKPEKFTTNSSDKLNLSHDTIVFDTILSQLYIGTPKSVNRQFVVRNPHDKKIKTTISLAGGAKSQFRLNVDGAPGIFFENIEIRPHDSVFVFVEAYANPNLNPNGNPLIIRDSIVFQTNGNFQNVQLLAWGQDAIYYMTDSIITNTVWADKTKPYVIYDYFKIKPGATLTIKEGVKVYFAPYSTIWTQGTLNVEGTANEPVIFEGDRTSDKYSDKYSAYKYYNLPGQWFGLLFDWPTKGNSIKHARLKNASYGIYMDSTSIDGNPVIKVYNTFIQNISSYGLVGNRSKVYIENSVLANCGSACLYTYKGGDYDLRHVTISGYCDFGGGNDPALAVSNRLRDNFGRVIETYPIKFSFLNSLVHGDVTDELALDIDTKQTTEITILGSAIKSTDASLLQAGTQNVLTKKWLFKDYLKYNFQLDTLSPAKDIGFNLNPLITKDFLDKIRDTKPDAGAFERIE